jgi:Coenzyme PQQ synthesis protein D (PqqD)
MTRYTCPPGVAAETDGDAVYAARLPDGPIMVLDGVAAVIWEEACASDEDVVARVAERTGVTPAEVADSVAEFLAQLVRAGLLAERE